MHRNDINKTNKERVASNLILIELLCSLQVCGIDIKRHNDISCQVLLYDTINMTVSIKMKHLQCVSLFSQLLFNMLPHWRHCTVQFIVCFLSKYLLKLLILLNNLFSDMFFFVLFLFSFISLFHFIFHSTISLLGVADKTFSSL